jgi:hypothetical protein
LLAKLKGKDLSSYLSELAEMVAGTRPHHYTKVTAADFDAALDELFAADTRRLPPVLSTYSREDIYIDHD